METPYRETVDHLGLEQREGEAVRVLGRWRDALRTRILLGSGVAGVGLGAIGFYLSVQLQLRIAGLALERIAVVMAAGFFISTMLAGRQVAKLVIARRTPRMIEELAEDYEIPAERLSEISDLLRGL